MSEQISENPQQAAQPGAPDPQPATQAPAPEQSADERFTVELVKKETGATHWNVAKGIWEKVTHAETGEPDADYVLTAVIGGVDVPLESYAAGRLETIVRSAQQAQQSSGS